MIPIRDRNEFEQMCHDNSWSWLRKARPDLPMASGEGKIGKIAHLHYREYMITAIFLFTDYVNPENYVNRTLAFGDVLTGDGYSVPSKGIELVEWFDLIGPIPDQDTVKAVRI